MQACRAVCLYRYWKTLSGSSVRINISCCVETLHSFNHFSVLSGITFIATRYHIALVKALNARTVGSAILTLQRKYLGFNSFSSVLFLAKIVGVVRSCECPVGVTGAWCESHLCDEVLCMNRGTCEGGR